MEAAWTIEDFTKATGRAPEQDDLDRCNCPDAGQLAHQSCGVCKEHKMPVFMCRVCFSKCFKPGFERL